MANQPQYETKTGRTVKTLILEIIAGKGTSHIKEIHLQVTEIRKNTPQHTVRARLSEMSRTDNLEEKLESIGNGFYGVYQENTNLCSVVSYKDRGPWGDNRYRGNCSGHLVKDLILRFGCKAVFDPSEGSGTVRDVVDGINKHLKKQIHYEGRDLKDGWDIISGDLPTEMYDFVWYHPPYWDIIRYSDNPNDLSNCMTLAEFEDKLNIAAERLSGALKPGGILAVLLGDKRKAGKYYPLMRTLLMNPKIGELRSIIIKLQHNCVSNSRSYNANPFFIPIKHEYCLIFEKR